MWSKSMYIQLEAFKCAYMRPNLLLIVLLMRFTWYSDPGQFFHSNQSDCYQARKAFSI